MSILPTHARMDKGAVADRLPIDLPTGPRRVRRSVTDFGLRDTSGHPPSERLAITRNGGVTDMKNLSPRLAPALAVRPPREMFWHTDSPSAPHGMAALGDTLYFVQGKYLYRIYGGNGSLWRGNTISLVATLSDTDKHMAVFGDRLFIFPDKVYVDTNGFVYTMEPTTGVLDNVVYHEDTITLPSGSRTWEEMGFEVGDGIRVVNELDNRQSPTGEYCIVRLSGPVAYLSFPVPVDVTCRSSIHRVIPDFDGVAVNGDRMYGFCGRDIYISAPGTPFCWVRDLVIRNGSAVLHTDTPGDITACTAWHGYLVFFKCDRIYKLMGNRTDSFTLQDTAAPGIPAALSGTLCELDGSLYYHADTGVYRYSGVYPERIGDPTGQAVSAGCGGSDGLGYYLSLCTENKWRQYLYMPSTHAWYTEDDLHAVAMLCAEGFLCIQDSKGDFLLCRADGRTWGLPETEETYYGASSAFLTLAPDRDMEPDPTRLVSLYIRASAPAGAEMRIRALYADGRNRRDVDLSDVVDEDVYTDSVELAAIEGGICNRLLRIPVHPRVADAVTLRLDLYGDWHIYSVTWEYELCN